MSEINVTRRGVLGGLLATAVMLKPEFTIAQAVRVPKYLLIAEGNGHQDMLMKNLNSDAKMKSFAQDGYKTINLELPHDFARIARGSDAGIARHVRAAIKASGQQMPNRMIEDTVDMYQEYGALVRELDKKAKKYGLSVNFIDPMSTKEILSLSFDVGQQATMHQQRKAIDNQMAGHIKRYASPSVNFIGNLHVDGLTRSLGMQNVKAQGQLLTQSLTYLAP